MKKYLIALVAFFLGIVFTSSIWAVSPSPSPSVEPSMAPISTTNSFELFWPLVAGKTINDSTYPVKILKENLRGYFIFGKPQKADYYVFLGTKRMLEVEKLLDEKDMANAEKTIISANKNFEKAVSNLKASGGNGTSEVANNINPRVTNLKSFIKSLIDKNADYKIKFEKTQSLLDELSSSI